MKVFAFVLREIFLNIVEIMKYIFKSCCCLAVINPCPNRKIGEGKIWKSIMFESENRIAIKVFLSSSPHSILGMESQHSIWLCDMDKDEECGQVDGTYYGIFLDSPSRIAARLERPSAPFCRDSFSPRIFFRSRSHFLDQSVNESRVIR
jgi:hypothetical protein